MAIATHERAVIDSVPKRLLIAGEWSDAGEGGTLPVEDPATGESLCEVADGRPEDAKDALAAAHDARAGWAASAPNDRAEILWRAFEALTARADELALLLMTLEMGKPVAESKAEIAYAAEFFRWFSGEALRITGDYRVAGTGAGRVLVMRQPVGPCLMITPWNFPMAMGTRKIGPAIAAGCTMVMKPAQQTPLSMLALASILEECGLPDGVLNVITSKSSGATMGPLIEDPRARKLSFTGSTEVGRNLIAQASNQVLKVSMELSGETLPSSCSTTPTSTPPWRAPCSRRCATSARRAPPPTAFTWQARWPGSSRTGWRQDGRPEARPRHRGRREGRPADRPGPALEGGRPRGGRRKGAKALAGARRVLLRAHRAG